MRIGINATSLSDRPSGAKQRFVGLYGALFRSRPDNRYVIYEPRDCRVGECFKDLANVTAVVSPLPAADRWARWARGLGYWRKRLMQDRLDVFEALHLPLVRSPNCPTLLTVHDARPILRDVQFVRRRLYREVLRRSLKQADAVVTVSETMREELLGVEPRASVTTIYNGVDAAPFEAAAGRARTVAETLGLPDRFILAVGHFEPRKNYGTLIEAMALLRQSDPTVGLAIVGRDGGKLAETRVAIERAGLAKTVRLLTDVDDWQLAGLYHAASIMAFPSTYEGFGIPVLEAMAAGCPTCLSDIPVFRELTEGAADYFPPLDASALVASIEALLKDPDRRREIAAYGRRRVGDFAFDCLAKQLDQLHRSLAAAAPQRAQAS